MFGLAKDGRPIYTPYYDNLKPYDDCDVDVCNGLMIGDHYAYVSTFFHPYILGCFGPGDSPNLSQRCSTRPRNCNSETDMSSLGGSTSGTENTGGTMNGDTEGPCSDGARPTCSDGGMP